MRIATISVRPPLKDAAERLEVETNKFLERIPGRIVSVQVLHDDISGGYSYNYIVVATYEEDRVTGVPER